MEAFSKHVDAMFKLIRAYAEREGLQKDVSGLLILRLLERDTGVPIAIAVVGEPAPLALVTCHDAIDALTHDALKEHTAQCRRIPSA